MSRPKHNAREGENMSEKQARELLDGLTYEDKLKLYEFIQAIRAQRG